MINKVFFQGNLTRNPDFRNTPAGSAVCTMTVAHNRKNGDKEETTFADVTVWGKSAVYCRDYLAKGSPVLIEGRLKLETWQGKDGSSKSKLAIVAENVQGLSRGSTGASNMERGSAQPQYRQMDEQYAPPSQHDIDKGNAYQPQSLDDDMPF